MWVVPTPIASCIKLIFKYLVCDPSHRNYKMNMRLVDLLRIIFLSSFFMTFNQNKYQTVEKKLLDNSIKNNLARIPNYRKMFCFVIFMVLLLVHNLK